MLEIIARSLQAEISSPPRPATRRPRGPNSILESHEAPTPRELDVLSLVTDGKFDREIAELLVLSKRTVQSHLRNLFKKADVKSRTALVCQAARLRWIS